MAVPKKQISLKIPKFMKGMSESRKSIVDTQLLRDDSIDKIATMIQQEWKLCSDILHGSLVKSIMRYKQTRIIPRQAQIVTKLGSPEHVSRLATLETQMENTLKPMQAMENLIAQQLARVEKMANTETKLPTLMDAQTKNMGLLWGMLKDLTVLQMNVGIIRRVPKKDTQTSLTREQLDYAQQLKDVTVPAEATMQALSYLASNGLISSTVLDDLNALDDYEEDEELESDEGAA
ncbi:MAG: hypothetical protein RR280_08510 [Bacteroidaceae bacterium]